MDSTLVKEEELSGSIENSDFDFNENTPISTNTTGNFYSRMAFSLARIPAKDWIVTQKNKIAPWAEFFNTSRYSAPKSISPIGPRIVKNAEKFQANYMFIFIGLFLFCVLTSPMLLVAIGGCLGACYMISLKSASTKFKLMGQELSRNQQYGIIGLISFPLFWLAGAGSAFFWVIGASFFVIMAHASLYKQLDEAELFELQMEEV